MGLVINFAEGGTRTSAFARELRRTREPLFDRLLPSVVLTKEGAEGGTRTHKRFLSLTPEASAFTNFATSA